MGKGYIKTRTTLYKIAPINQLLFHMMAQASLWQGMTGREGKK